MSKTIFIFLLTFFLHTLSVNAATFYVDLNGSDQNNGTLDNPFRTIQKAAGVVKAGDTVKVRPGVYYERVVIQTSGLPDQPITFEGEKGAIGQWLTAIDGSVPTSGWVLAPEVAPGVYKTTSIPFNPYCMTVAIDGAVKDIPKLHNPPGDTHEGFIYLSKAADATEVTQTLGVEVNFWDGIEALYYHVDGTTYLRFRNGDNPNNKTITASMGTSDGSCFGLPAKSYITIKNFEIRGAWRGIDVRNTSHHIIVEGNQIIVTGREKIFIQSGANNIDVRNNVMHMGGLSTYLPGAWANGTYDGSAPYNLAVKEHIYRAYKFYLSDSETSSQEDSGIFLSSAGPNIRIYDNEIFNTLTGISLFESQNVDIYGNTIHGISSVGISLGPGTSAKVYGNLIYNCNINMRFGTVEDASNGRSAHVYNNKFYNPEGVGNHTYFHYKSPSSTQTEFSKFYFYHNSFAGGNYVFVPSAYALNNGGLKNTRFINNIFSANQIYGNGGLTFYEDDAMVELFDYNWLGGNYLSENPPAWAGSNNIFAKGNFVWSNVSLPDFILPKESLARSAGIDLSAEFKINGLTYQPLPGLESSYYAIDGPPDLGIILLLAPSNLRIVSP